MTSVCGGADSTPPLTVLSPRDVPHLIPLPDRHVDDSADEALAAVAGHVELARHGHAQVVGAGVAADGGVGIEGDVEACLLYTSLPPTSQREFGLNGATP